MPYGIATIADGLDLSDKAIEWFENRGIGAETIVQYGIYTTDHEKIGRAIVYPYLENGEVVNRKYRSGKKEFAQDYNAKKIFWNHDAIKQSVDENMPLLIAEGENDALSAIEAGYVWATSVPDGAPQKLKDDVDPEHDTKFSYVWDSTEDLSKVQKILIATDNDGPGEVLREELARRLDRARCAIVRYPDDCKDLNDVLVKHGKQSVHDCIENAEPYPIKGLYDFSNFIGEFKLDLLPCRMGPELDRHIMPFRGCFMVVSGTPNSGKSTWVDSLVFNLTHHGEHAAVCCFETGPRMYRKYFHNRFLGYLGRHPNDEERARADEVLNQRYKVIHHTSVADDDDLSLEDIIELATISVMRYGTTILVIDPWNEIEHKRKHNESETDYTNRAIRMLKRFAEKFDVLVIVVAHPTKMSEKGQMRKPNLYDISGSSAWANKADLGVLLWRPDMAASHVDIISAKVRFREETRSNVGTVAMTTQAPQMIYTYLDLKE